MPDSRPLNRKFSHLGICVSDIERSLRFYRDALGFTVAENYEIGPEVSRTMEIDNVSLRAQYLRREDITLELLEFHSPPATGPQERRALNQFGLTHLCFWVDDLEAAIGKVCDAGGAVHEQTRTQLPTVRIIYCTDPDGIRVELLQRTVPLK